MQRTYYLEEPFAASCPAVIYDASTNL